MVEGESFIYKLYNATVEWMEKDGPVRMVADIPSSDFSDPDLLEMARVISNKRVVLGIKVIGGLLVDGTLVSETLRFGGFYGFPSAHYDADSLNLLVESDKFPPVRNGYVRQNLQSGVIFLSGRPSTRDLTVEDGLGFIKKQLLDGKYGICRFNYCDSEIDL